MWTEQADRVANALLRDLAADEWGTVAPGVYDTGRLVALAPWLAGHQARVNYLCQAQRPDGGWGGQDGYQVVPTLSATTALLAEVGRNLPRGRRKRLARAITRGLAALQRWQAHGGSIPGTLGVDLIVPALQEELRTRLASTAGDPYLVDLAPGPDTSLDVAADLDHRALPVARERFTTTRTLPQRWWPCLEVFGPAAVAAPGVRPAMGAVGCSPAATAAWLGGASGDPRALAFLHTLQERYGGPVPGVTPVTYFEAAFVLNSLASSGLSPTVPATVLNRLEASLTAQGAPAGPGLPPDGADTAAVLAALMRHGRIRAPDCLLAFHADGSFTCFAGEPDTSVATNARALEALALYLTHRPDHWRRFGPAAARTADWVLDHQRPDGSWWDRWHASPYYATAACVLALLVHNPAWARVAIDKAVAWVCDTQQPDGSWGRWQGTVEETAYAVQILTKAARHDAARAALARARTFLAHPPPLTEHPPLWHAKDLVAPLTVVRALHVAATRLADIGAGERQGA